MTGLEDFLAVHADGDPSVDKECRAEVGGGSGSNVLRDTCPSSVVGFHVAPTRVATEGQHLL